MSIVLTKAALALKNAENNFQFVKFESHKPKKRSLADDEKSDIKSQTIQHSKKDLDLKKIRHEVVKFGMSGFDSTKKEEAKIALAVSLGAKPPKRQYINYKELMQKRKEEKQQEKDEKQQMLSKNLMKTSGKKKTNNDVGYFLSGYGKVQKKDLNKDDNGNKKKKKKK
ncbi:LOW QUALITY PROTEIN: 40S small subunit processome assembly factor 1 [Aphomia sociella]